MQTLGSVAEKIIQGGVGVIPTDTIYGIVASALHPEAVGRIYQIKGRESTKPFVVIVSEYDQLSGLGIELNRPMRDALEKIWPAAVSVILPCHDDMLSYLHRGTNSLAVRMPAQSQLISLLAATGPLVATSANISGQEALSTMDEVCAYLPNLDFYISGATGTSASRLVMMNSDGQIESVVRS